MASLSRSRRSQVTNYWPGFVDALSSLLLVIIFLLSLFMLTQFFLGQEIQGKDTAMTLLNSQIAELTDLLQLERSNNSDLTGDLATLQATLANTTADRDKLQTQISGIGNADDGKDAQIAGLNADLAKQQDLSNDAAAQVALLNQQLTALLTERVRIVGNVIPFVVEDRQSKIEMKEPRVDQFQADHLATSQHG